MKIKSILRRSTEGRTGFLTVTALVFLITLTVLLPAADEYNELRGRRAGARARLAKTRHDLARIDEIRREAAQRRSRLRDLEARAVPAGEVHLFRQEVVELARRSGCRLRQVRVGEPRARAWNTGDDPLKTTTRPGPKEAESPYTLNTSSIFLSVSGTLSGIKEMLAELHSAGRLIHGKSLTLSATRDNPEELVLDLELLLFDLTEVEATAG